MAVQDYFKDIAVPTPEELELQLEQLVQQGILTPEEAQAALVESSAFDGISLDPNLKQNQMDALMGLQEISDAGGMTAMDKANLSRIQSQEDAAARGKRDAIIQNANARGMGGSGLEIMAQLQNQQDSAMKTSQRNMDVTAQAQQRALDALIQGGNMSSQMIDQDFNQQAKKADANDAISRFNAQNQQQINMYNTGTRNDAQAKNLAAKQQVADANTTTRNTQQEYNKNLIQQQYDNRLKKASGQAGIGTNNEQMRLNQKNADRQNTQNLIGTGLTAGAMFLSDEREKENIEEFNPSDFLDSLTGYKFNYKNKANGEGKQVGVMAQDLEKSEAGSKMVIDTPEGKVVDYNKSGPATFASLANLNDRLKKLEKGE